MRDAIYIARRLGLDYIWIDALCIIQRQQDHKDWLCESGQIRSIYGGSQINIATSSAMDVHQGCLVESNAYIGGLSVLITTSASGGSHSIVFFDPMLLDTAPTSHLLQRAWAFQERLLAPRTIHFNEHGALWECRATTLSSHLPGGFDNVVCGPKMVCADDEEWDWKEIVNSYSHTQLTVSSGRLPALAGVARRHCELAEDQYLAGMWRGTLVDQLVWAVYTYYGEFSTQNRRPE